MTKPSKFTVIDASFGSFFNRIWRRKLCWGIIFTWVIYFFYFLLFIYFNKQTRYFSCLKTDHAPLIILKFIFETFKSYYFPKSFILFFFYQ